MKEITEYEMIEEIAMGVGCPVEDLKYIYDGIKNKSMAYEIDLRQFSGRGIPIFKSLSNILNQPIQLVVHAHTFDTIERAMFSMVEPGGIFHGLKDARKKQYDTSLGKLIEDFRVECLKIGVKSFSYNAWTGELKLYYTEEK